MSKRTTLALIAAGVTGLALTVPIGAASAATPLFTITQNVLPGLANATDLGPAPANTPLNLVVTVARPDVTGEKALQAAQNDPASPSYHHFLTPAAFTSQFGVPPSRRSAVTSYLTGGGLSVDSVSAAGDVYSVHGTTAQAASVFQTAFRDYRTDGTSFVANTSAPISPAALRVTNVIGLNTLQHYSLPSKPITSQGTCVLTLCTGGTTPSDLWTAYSQPANHTGAGQQVAIFGEGATDGVISDLRAFETHFSLPQVPVTVIHPAGETDFSDDSGHAEWNIDTQASTGMAPNVDALKLYFSTDLSDADVNKVFSQFTDDPTGPMQASASYGECETIPVISATVGQALANPSLPISLGLGNNSDAALTEVTRQATMEGKTIFVSTGDTGSSCPIVALPVIGAGNGVLNQVVPVTNSPASLPNVTAVGGTVLYTNGSGQRTREYGWAFSGGGSTLFTPAPAYQQGTAGLTLPCVTDPTVTCRGIADVSAQSGDVIGNGYDIVESGTFTEGGGGGTSLSSPLWAGMWTRIQSGSTATGGNGFANYSLYRVGKNATTYARDFFDVSSTDLATGLPASNGLYTTGPGWDYVTGFGTPKVSGLICDLDGGC